MWLTGRKLGPQSGEETRPKTKDKRQKKEDILFNKSNLKD